MTDKKKTKAQLIKELEAMRRRVAELETAEIQHRQTVQVLRESEEEFKSLAEESPNMIFINKMGRVVYANKRCEEIMGYSKEEFYAEDFDFMTLIAPEYRNLVKTNYQKHMMEENVPPYDYKLLTKDGREIIAIHTTKLIDFEGEKAILGIITDITERKQAEERLRESQARCHTLIETIPDGIQENDTSGIITFSNAAHHKMHGYAEGELLGKAIWDIVESDSDKRNLREYLAMLVKDQPPPTPYYTKDRTKDGGVIDVQVDWNYKRDASGRVVGFISVIRDITERVQAEKALRESNLQLEEALTQLKQTQQKIIHQERLRALGAMVSGIAHTFNNALTPIVGFSELLLDRPQNLDDKEKVERYLKMINAAAKDTATVVRRLREFYRPRKKDEVFQPISLNTLVLQTLQFTEPKWKNEAEASGITIDIDTDLHETPPLLGNEAELREGVTNLIFNTVEAMPQGGTITLRTRLDGTDVVLEVSDTGIGMTEEVRQHCLDPFYSTKDDRAGGMGLAMVFGMVQRHGGELFIDSRPGQGTTVTIRFPVQPEGQTEDEDPRTEVVSRPLHVLAVDGEMSVRQVVTECLVDDGHTVETAANGHEGLEKFRAGRFDVVVVDRAMPGMNGIELAAAIKGLMPNIPVILLTGFGDLMQATGEKPPCVDVIVSKPITPAELREVFRKVI